MRNKIEHTATYLKRRLKTAAARDGGVGALTRLTIRPSEAQSPAGSPGRPWNRGFVNAGGTPAHEQSQLLQ